MYKPPYRITPYLLNLIDEASRLKTLIEQSSLRLSWLPLLQSEARRRGAHSSTAIEGNPLTLDQVKAIDQGGRVRSSKVFEQEVAGYLRAIRWVEKNISKPINRTNLLKLHKIILKGTQTKEKCGAFKVRQNYIIDEKGRACRQAGIRIYTPPGPKETPELVDNLLDWVNSNKKLHPIILCAILHHRLASIHPFSDGNGRAARLLGTWILYKKGFDINHIFSLDDFFAADRKFYYLKIQQVRELDDNLTHWIEYVARGIVSTLKDVKARIEHLQVKKKVKVVLSSRQEELVKLLRDAAPLPVALLQRKMRLTRARINQIIVPLIKDGLIVKEGKSKATRYRLAFV